MDVKVVAVVPARMGSSRFPGKPLALIRGLPMIEHVRRRAMLSTIVDEVVVATCDSEIRKAVEAHGGTCVMTASTHERCTERVAEAAEGLEGDIFVIVQGDEPLLDPDDLQLVVAPLLRDRDTRGACTNLLSPLEGPQDLANPDIVKAALARDGRILFLTRAPIPFSRSQGGTPPVYRQTGIMAFQRAALELYSAGAPTPLEKEEAIDMLRLLEVGIPLHGVLTGHATRGVDRPEDVPVVEAALSRIPRQQKLFELTLARSLSAR